ncbi:hypothetical protein [Catellatospora sp. NPDC049133]|uniref:hypothetical protein n=1 Tax=Catellatospora sp. NPDC049133 TaxID=3155499 RepID=UPI0033FE3BD6
MAIESLAASVSPGDRTPGSVTFILDHTCPNVIEQTSPECRPVPLPEQVRADIVKAPAAHGPARFVADGKAVTGQGPEGPQVADNGAPVVLGPITLTADHAQVPLSAFRAGLNGRGLTYELTRQDQAWTITGTVGPQWTA